jgi:glycosyltransferase involved in cell wall biosynthesis
LAKAASLVANVRVVHATLGEGGKSAIEDQGLGVTEVGYSQKRLRWVFPYLKAILSGARRIRSEFPFQLVHAHCAFPAGLAGLCLSLRYGVPLVLTEHWAPYDQLMKSSALTAVCIRMVVRRAAAVLAVSQALRAEMVQWTGRSDISVVPPAVNLALFRPSSTSARSGPVRLLFVGDLSHARKRLEDVLQALKRLVSLGENDWSLEVVGGGTLLAGYVSQARALGLESRVQFQGELRLEDVAEAMKRCDVFVLPSNYETFGVVYAEAMACGKPVVGTRCGGPEDFVTDDVGRLVTPRDVLGLSEAIRTVAARLPTFEAARLRALAASRFSHEAVGRMHEEVYRRVLG